ncbi:unnamed protein product [Peronospora belbahrii]|uniref:Uncharacterized protein n=1 Tax=Peronospora belbahrii TaxID=622444 RepID=A0ABN8CXY9_9STRA|nr:unnamed protein product [Peronospora belbahrii]
MPDAKAVKALESNVELLSRSLFATTDTSAKRNLRRTKNNASPDGEERGIDAANWSKLVTEYGERNFAWVAKSINVIQERMEEIQKPLIKMSSKDEGKEYAKTLSTTDSKSITDLTPTYPRAVPRSHIINTRYLSNSHTKLCNFYGHE